MKPSSTSSSAAALISSFRLDAPAKELGEGFVREAVSQGFKS
jgi:hypothetical protein